MITLHCIAPSSNSNWKITVGDNKPVYRELILVQHLTVMYNNSHHYQDRIKSLWLTQYWLTICMFYLVFSKYSGLWSLINTWIQNATVKLLWIINYHESKRKQSSVPDLHADLIMHQEIFVLGFLVLRVFKYFLQFTCYSYFYKG